MNENLRRCCIFLIGWLLFISGCSVGRKQPPKLTPVTVHPRWTHLAQLAGFYAAEGLEVKFLDGGRQCGLAFSKPWSNSWC
jgi:hypothetical protein